MAAQQQQGKQPTPRLTLQKEVFTAQDERMLGMAVVSKPGKKKKRINYLCVSVNLESKTSPVVYISQVKQDDKKERSDKGGGLRRAHRWKLSELRMVDGKSPDSEVPEFDLHFEKGVYKWIAGSIMEKKAFVICLYKLVHKYPEKKKAKFVNVDQERLDELTQVTEAAKARGAQVEDEEEVIQQEEYQELTEKEQEDLEKLLKEEERRSGGQAGGVQDIAAFTEHLSQQLGQLDDANIHMLMGSEEQIQRLMKQLDNSLMEIQQMETKLTVYDQLLTSVRGSMGSLQKEYYCILVWDKNLRLLLKQVEEIVNKLDLDPRVERVLKTSPLSDEHSIRDCTNAVRDLHRVMNQQLSQGVQIMQAVSEQKQAFSNLSFMFGKKLQDHLIEKFRRLADKRVEAVMSRNQGSLPSLPGHSAEHSDLMQYRELTKWMRDCQSDRFGEVCVAYCNSFKRAYLEEIKAFMADVKSLLSRGMEPKKGLLAKVGSEMLTTSLRMGGSSANVSSPRQNIRNLSTSLMDFTSSPIRTAGGATETVEKPRLDQVFLLVMEQVHPVCVSEQKFCSAFFHFPKMETGTDEDLDESTASIRSEDGVESVDSVMDVLGLTKKHQHAAAIDVGSVTGAGVMGMLRELFGCLLTEIQGFVQFGEKLDSYNGLYLLMAVKQRLMFAREGGNLSYLEHCLEQAQIFIRRLFEKLIDTKKKTIEDCKVPRKSGKWGVLSCVTEFSNFAEQSERIVMGAEQREEINTAYQVLIQSLFDTIERVANEHPKTRDVVKFENYHWLYDILSQHKITCLDTHREEAKRRFRAHQQEYVIACLGKPLKNLSAFFEGVEGLLASGMKPEQVGFWRDYSKAELQKCISAYPGKEVKKGLEKLYRRIDGDLSDEVGLLRVTWGAMQKAFMEQYQHFEKLIAQCYPGANIKLDFNLPDLIDYFREISENK